MSSRRVHACFMIIPVNISGMQVVKEGSPIALLTDGQLFGETVLYHPTATRSATVVTNSYCQLMMLSKAAMDNALSSRPLQYQKVKDKARSLYRAHISRSAADNEAEAVVREALKMPSTLDAASVAAVGNDSHGPAGSRGSQLWKSIAPWQDTNLAGGHQSESLQKLSDDVSELKYAVNEMLQALQPKEKQANQGSHDRE